MAAFTVIDHTELGAAAASWEVTSIPSSYDHLLIVASIRSSKSDWDDKVDFQMGNGSLDTGTNYSDTVMYASNAAPTSGRTSGATTIDHLWVNGDDALADSFSPLKIWIPNYANTTGYKQVICTANFMVVSVTTRWSVHTVAGLWSSTSAVDCVGITETGDDMMQYSTFTLYGVTGA
jgi:hypothetical protein